MAVGPSLPSVLPSVLALQDETTTAQQINAGVAQIAEPEKTPIYICALNQCNRLFPSRERVMVHRKNFHGTEDDQDIITWNTEKKDPEEAKDSAA